MDPRLGQVRQERREGGRERVGAGGGWGGGGVARERWEEGRVPVMAQLLD